MEGFLRTRSLRNLRTDACSSRYSEFVSVYSYAYAYEYA